MCFLASYFLLGKGVLEAQEQLGIVLRTKNLDGANQLPPACIPEGGFVEMTKEVI